MTQGQALGILKTGANVFLTGEPGAGKTYTINEYLKYLRACKMEVAVTASTGIAATHIGGMTIHSWSGVGIKSKLSKYDVDEITSREYVVKRISRARVLVIDEVSMLSANMLEMVDVICRAVKGFKEPFGGMQIVFVGDFFQLPPVSRGDDNVSFAYEANAWKTAQLVTCYLTEQHRQDDDDFLKILSSVRSNSFNEEHLACLFKRQVTQGSILPDGVLRLFSHNIDVDKTNESILNKLAGNSRIFTMTSRGPSATVESLRKGCLSPQSLALKKDAVVMFTKNNPQGHFVNGTLGTVLNFSGAGGLPVVKTRDGRRITVEPMDWIVEENGKEHARLTQLPIRLAWAMTVHKSQGVSLDEAVIDLSEVFEYGQGYVALSRVKRLSGLHLLGWNERAFCVHPDVLEQDSSFRQASEAGEAMFCDMDKEKLNTLHVNFIKSLGGKEIIINKIEDYFEPIKPFDAIRKQYSNAYRRWDDEQDKKLGDLFKRGMTIRELARIFERKEGGIRSRLEKLGLIKRY